MALPIGPFPYILTNGTLADANQVMADFNMLLNGINGLAPLAVPVAGSTSNIAATEGSATTSITVTADTVTVATALNGTAYTLTSFNQSFNGLATGPGGMDTGTLPSNSFVALYAIYNPSAPAISILGKSAAVTAPTIYNGVNMPAGYTASALLTVVPTNATPAIKPCIIRGKWVNFVAVNTVNTGTNQPTLVAQAVGSVPPAAIGLSGYSQINPSANSAGVFGITIAGDSNGSGQQATFNYLAASSTTAVGSGWGPILMASPQTIYYSTVNVSGNAAALINVSAYLLP